MIKTWIKKLKSLCIYDVGGSASRYFIFAAAFELDKYKAATQSFGHVRKTNFPTITNLKDVVRSYNQDAFNIVILSVCEVKEDEFKRFFSEQD